MKKHFWFLMSLAVALTTSSCHDDSETEEEKPVTVDKFDELAFLQDNIVEINEKGEIVARINGLPLEKADTTVVYIGKDNVAQAEETFLGWLAPNTVVSHVNDGLEVSLTDSKGALQGKAYFRVADTSTTFHSNPVLAEVTFSPGTAIKHVTKIVFLPHSSWPIAAKETPYYVGDIILNRFFTVDEGGGPCLCVREAVEGQAGLAVFLSHRKGRWDKYFVKQFASPSMAKTVSGILRQQFPAFQSYFKQAQMDLVSGDYYWINDVKDMIVETGIYSIRLSDGNIDWWATVWKHPSWRYMQVFTFGMEDFPDE